MRDAADVRQIQHGVRHAQILGNPRGALQLNGVALPVLEANGLHVARAAIGDGLEQAGGGILPAREDNECCVGRHFRLPCGEIGIILRRFMDFGMTT